MSAESAPFTTALTPIYSRSRTVRSSAGVANHYPRSSTPLHDVNTSSSTNRQEPIARKKSSRTAVTAGKPLIKRKSHTDGVREKIAKREASTAAASKNDRVTASTVSGHSRFIESLAGELQKQKREVVFNVIYVALSYICLKSVPYLPIRSFSISC